VQPAAYGARSLGDRDFHGAALHGIAALRFLL
jgi:hypothetical protein